MLAHLYKMSHSAIQGGLKKSVPILNNFFHPLKIKMLQIFEIGGDYAYAAKKINVFHHI